MSALNILILATYSVLVIHVNAGGNHKLVFSMRGNISTLTTEGSVIQTIVAGQEIVQDIDVDVTQRSLFWLEYSENVIRKGRFRDDGGVTDIRDVVQYDTRIMDSIAVDWIYGHLYWINNAIHRIEVTDFNGTYRKSFHEMDGRFSMRLIVDPRVGWLFYLRWDNRPLLERLSTDGDVSSRSVIYDSQNRRNQPTSHISADYSTQRLYWLEWNDMYPNRIRSVDYDGLNLRQFTLSEPKIEVPHRSVIVGDFIYWTDDRLDSIRRVNKETGQNFEILVDNLPKVPFAIRAMDKRSQPDGVNYCVQQNSNCSHICLPRAHSTGFTKKYSCACPDELELGSDQRICINTSV